MSVSQFPQDVSTDGAVTAGHVAVFADTAGNVIEDGGAPGTGTVGGSTGATDNAILRADGTGGSTLQNSAVTIADTTGVIAGTRGVTFSGSTSGTLALVPTAVSGTNTVTLPADTGTAALIAQTITNGDTTHAPSGDAVFDALAGKQDTSSSLQRVTSSYDFEVGGDQNWLPAVPADKQRFIQSVTIGGADLTGADAALTFGWDSSNLGSFDVDTLENINGEDRCMPAILGYLTDGANAIINKLGYSFGVAPNILKGAYNGTPLPGKTVFVHIVYYDAAI